MPQLSETHVNVLSRQHESLPRVRVRGNPRAEVAFAIGLALSSSWRPQPVLNPLPSLEQAILGSGDSETHAKGAFGQNKVAVLPLESESVWWASAEVSTSSGASGSRILQSPIVPDR